MLSHPDGEPNQTTIAAKRALREQRIASRRGIPVAQRLADDAARDARVLALLPELLPAASVDDAAVVACYLSVAPDAPRPEPGTLALAESLHQQGMRVLVPKLSPTASGPRHDPDWAWYRGADDLVDGLWGIPEPSGEGMGGDALALANVVLCSALAATPDGRRLGVGGGWYDRALGTARPGVALVALVDDADLLDELPLEPHDRLVDWVVTPSRTIACRAAQG